MNAPITFDTLAFVKRLEASGMQAAHAEALAGAMREIAFETMATKADLRELELRLKHDLTVRLGTIVAVATGLIVAILGALISFH